jgi:FMN-dependent NADH-azoreductase
MLKLLHLDASPRGDFSISRQLSAAAVAAWKDKHSGGKVVERDLTKTEMTFVDLDWIIGAFSTPDQLTDNHKSALAVSDTLIAELLEADEIVSALQCTTSPCPPSLRRGSATSYEFGKTFNYLATGPEGLAEGRKVVVAPTPRLSLDKPIHQSQGD